MRDSDRSDLRAARTLSVALLAVAMAPLVGCSLFIQTPVRHRAVPPEEFDRRFSASEVRDDVEYFLATAERVHPDLYAVATRDEIRAVADRIVASVASPATRIEILPRIAELAAAAGDPHTYVMFWTDEWGQAVAGGERLLPLDVDCRDARATVRAAWPADCPIAAGDELLAVNGAPFSAIIDESLRQRSGDREYRLASIARSMRMILWLRGIRAPFRVEYRATGSPDPRVVELTGVGAAQLQTPPHAQVKPPPPPAAATANYRFERLPGEIGYIDFRSMTDRGAFDRFLREVFDDLRKNPVRGLIVDLRRNGGGDSELGAALLSYITDSPFRMAARKEWKISRELREYLKSYMTPLIRWMPIELLHPMGRKLWLTPVGQIAVFDTPERRPPRRANRFRGPVCFLIGRNTFSSAMMLADAVAAYRLATLIGEPTGGEPNAFGEVYAFDLPITRIHVGVSTARFVGAGGDASATGGVRPHITLIPTDDDVKRGADAVLDAARRWIDERAPRAHDAAN